LEQDRPEGEPAVPAETTSTLDVPQDGIGSGTIAQSGYTEEELIHAMEALGRALLDKVLGRPSQSRPEALEPLINAGAKWLAHRLKD
jgi:hypothetical protein